MYYPVDDLSREQVVAIRSQSVIGLPLLLLLLSGTINFDRDLALVHPCQTVINVSKDRYLLWSRPSSPPPSRHPRTPATPPCRFFSPSCIRIHPQPPLSWSPAAFAPSSALLATLLHRCTSHSHRLWNTVCRLPNPSLDSYVSSIRLSAFYFSLLSLSVRGWWSNSIDRCTLRFASNFEVH